MNPPDFNTKDLPNPSPQILDGGSSKDEACKDTSKPQEGASSPESQGASQLAAAPKKIGVTHASNMTKSISPAEELQQSLRKKADEAAVGLESVFGQEAIDRAKKSWVKWKCEDIKKAATNYLRKSGKACKVDQADLVREILTIENIKVPTNLPKKSGKQTSVSKGTKGSGNDVQKGGSHAS